MKNKRIYIFLGIYGLIAALVIVFFDGTGDAGDSIMHYLFAKSAPLHPELFFDHWAKPVYVLLASPFAQFGFVGIKVFNATVVLFTLFFTFQTALLLKLKNAIVVTVLLVFSPMYFVLTFSGLTEPLFALFLSIVIFAILKQKYIAAALLVSLLPFVRSEGLILLGIFGLYLLLKGKWKLIPFLAFGHIAYSVAGYFFYDDIFWTITKIPYAHMHSVYGSGKLFHFFEYGVFVTGVPGYILFWVGVVAIIWKTLTNKTTLELQVLVVLGAFAFLIAHSLFWYFGIFNSMGLIRVVIGIIPYIALISLFGFNFISEDLLGGRRIPKRILQGLFIAYIIIFPFLNNPASIDWEKDMNLSLEQKTALQTGLFLKNNTKGNPRYIYNLPYLSIALQIDHFDRDKHLRLTADYLDQAHAGDIIIWENRFSAFESGITKEQLDNNAKLTRLLSTDTLDDEGRKVQFAVYLHQ